MKFGEQLRRARKKRKLSTQELADACGISRSYLTLMETNNRLPGKKVIPRIAESLQIKTHVVINWYLEDLRTRLET